MSAPAKPVEARELRLAVTPVVDMQVRDQSATGDGTYTITGYAAVFDEETTLYDGVFWKLREKIAHGAFTDVLTRGDLDCHLVIGHNNDLVMARTGVTGVGGLELTEDGRGLRVFARVDPEISYIRDLARLMKVPDGSRRAVVDQMSFAFTVAEDERTVTTAADGTEDELRVITRIKDLYDVTVCPQGAYPQTSAQLRSLIAAVGRTGAPVGHDPVAHTAGGDPVAPNRVGGAATSRLAAARARARLIRSTTLKESE